ncbi:MAG: permease-like cell division protein FtsX, partial [bacterium]
LGMLGKMSAYLKHHRQVGFETLRNLFSTLLTSLMTWMVIGIALALPAMLYILLTNLGNLGGEWDGKPRLSLYLKAGTSEKAGIALSENLFSDPDVAMASYITSDSALAEFQKNSGFEDVLASLPNNPLPAVIEIELEALSPAETKLKVTQVESWPEVESISVDLEWIERLFVILALGERFVMALSMFLGLGVLLSIGNTIRLAIENRRAEIEVVKLVGGTDGFVRRPFLYLGFWYGLGGAVGAWLMVQASLLFLSEPIERLLLSYQEEFTLIGLGASETAVLLGIGCILGVLGAALAVGRHLHRIEPQ